jgi:triosephosphate isomerase
VPTDDAMPRPRAVVGVSLKAYFGYRQTLEWCAQVAALPAVRAARAGGQLEIFVLPSFPAIVPALGVLAGTGVSVGGQTVSRYAGGPHTGEVTAGMLAEAGCTHVLIGHAERRRAQAETDAVVAAQVAAAVAAGLCPVLCVGEPDRVGADQAARHCQAQLTGALSALTAPDIARSRIIVAYEPVWAIGAEQPAPDSHVTQVCRELSSGLGSVQPGAGPAGVIYGGAAGPGQLGRLYGPVSGLFLGRFAHQVAGLAAVLDDALHCVARTPAS